MSPFDISTNCPDIVRKTPEAWAKYRHFSAYHSVLPTFVLIRAVIMACERGFESRDAEVGSAFLPCSEITILRLE